MRIMNTFVQNVAANYQRCGIAYVPMLERNGFRTVPGIGPGSWDSSALAREQEQHGNKIRTLLRAIDDYCSYADGFGDVRAPMDVLVRFDRARDVFHV